VCVNNASAINLSGTEALEVKRYDLMQSINTRGTSAYAVITKPSRECTGNAFLCEDVLAAEGVTDFDRYAYQPGAQPQADLFVDHT